MSENIMETNKNGTAGTEKPEKKHCGLSRILNKYFHHIDKGGSMKSEITASLPFQEGKIAFYAEKKTEYAKTLFKSVNL